MTGYDEKLMDMAVNNAILFAKRNIGKDILFRIQDSDLVEKEGHPERYIFHMVCTKDGDEFDMYRMDFGAGYMTLSTRSMSEHDIKRGIKGFCREFLNS